MFIEIFLFGFDSNNIVFLCKKIKWKEAISFIKKANY